MFNLGIALVFVGLLGTLLFFSLLVKSRTDLKRKNSDVSQTVFQIGMRLGLALSFGGLGLFGLALVILAGVYQ